MSDRAGATGSLIPLGDARREHDVCGARSPWLRRCWPPTDALGRPCTGASGRTMLDRLRPDDDLRPPGNASGWNEEIVQSYPSSEPSRERGRSGRMIMDVTPIGQI